MNSNPEGREPLSFDLNGERLKLVKETRWSRRFASLDGRRIVLKSRLEDGSASITLTQLDADWSSWTREERGDFCNSIRGLRGPIRIDVLRFLIKNADADLLRNVAMELVDLPSVEIVPAFSRWIQDSAPGRATNYVQALGWTKAREGTAVIAHRLTHLKAAPSNVDESARTLINLEELQCIRQLIELGRSPSEYQSEAIRFATHSAPTVQHAYRYYLAEYFE